jgi:single-strand DNA-binding protein
MSNQDYSLTLIHGNLGKDPTMRFTGAGKAVTTFSVACNDSYTNAAGETVTNTAWYTVETWGKLAEVCNNFLKKGRRVQIQGRIKPQRAYDKSDGTGKGYSGLEITADNVKFLGAPTAVNGDQAPEETGEPVGAPGATIDFN